MNKKILIIDNSPELIKDALPMYGYEADIALDGIEGIKKINKNEYDLVLLDILIPKMDGWETLKFIRTNSKHKTIPIIILTSINTDAKMVLGLKLGADDYITKPCTLPNLLARIEAIIRRRYWEQAEGKQTKPLGKEERHEDLTRREAEILSFVAKGNSNNDIAKKLFLKDTTVKAHLNRIYKKLNVESRVQATLVAMKMHLV